MPPDERLEVAKPARVWQKAAGYLAPWTYLYLLVLYFAGELRLSGRGLRSFAIFLLLGYAASLWEVWRRSRPVKTLG